MAKKFYCENCKTSTTHEREETLHILHFLMTLLFFPWIIIWGMRYAMKGWKCSECSTVKK